MKICLILLLLFDYTESVTLPQYANSTTTETCNKCEVKESRYKRALEYTRWRDQKDTPTEFIVKVFDEDSKPMSKSVVGVNVAAVSNSPATKIIVGSLLPTSTTPKDYSRFVQSFTKGTYSDAVKQKEKIIIKGAIIKPNQVLSHRKHIPGLSGHRDESPPLGPQFLSRTDTYAPLQYAPIISVSFGQSATQKPLTPGDIINRAKLNTLDSKISTVNDLRKTKITSVESDYDDTTFPSNLASRTTLKSLKIPERPTKIDGIDQDIFNPYHISDMPFSPEIVRKNYEHDATTSKMDKDIYHWFYQDYHDSVKSRSDLDDNDEAVSSNTNSLVTLTFEPGQTVNTTEEVLVPGNVSEITYDDDNEGNLNLTVITKQFERQQDISEKNENNIGNHALLKNRKNCSLLNLRPLNFNSSATFPELVAKLKLWADSSPVTHWIDITRGNFTTMENPIYMIIVDDPSSGQSILAKETVVIVAGIQGRDHHAVAAAMYILHQLIERPEAHRDLLSKYRFWIIPVFNPDGYEYSTNFPTRRDWRKNLRMNWEVCKDHVNILESCKLCEVQGLRCIIQPCHGVNLDRNFEYQWIPSNELKAEHPCGDLYAGQHQLSETETYSLTNFLHEQKTPIHTFIAFKEGDVLGVTYPYSHTRKRRAFDHVYRQRATYAASAAYTINGRTYVAGQTSEFLPLNAGGIEDWIDGHLGIDNTYAIIMFRPTETYTSKLSLERIVNEAYAAVDTLLLQKVTQQVSPMKVDFSGTPVTNAAHGTRKLQRAILVVGLILIVCS